MFSKQDLVLAAEVGKYHDDALGYVIFAFPWDSNPALQLVELEEPYRSRFNCKYGPDVWACEFLDNVSKQVKEHKFDGVNAVDAIREAVSSGHGIGKALALDTVIDTPKGKRIWSDIKIGDELFSSDGKTTKVIAQYHHANVVMYRVKFDDGSYIDCCEDHIWTVKGRNQRRTKTNWINLSTKQILEKGVKRSNGVVRCKQWQIPSVKPVQYDQRELIVHPYTLGVWLGDGGRNSSRITSGDYEVIDHLRFAGEKVTKDASLYTYGISMLKSKLDKLGVADKYSYQKSVPKDYLESDAESRSEILRGLLDTDGEVAKHGSIVFSSCSLQLANDVVWLSRSLGGKARLQPTTKLPKFRDKNGDLKNGLPCHRVTITMPDDFKSFYISRKQARISNVEARYLTRWIESIEQLSNSDAMCVTVDAPDGLFVANDFIVTHNSAMTGWLVSWIMSTRPYAQGTVTANTGAQLETKTWAQIQKWVKLSITAHWFEINTTKLYHKEAPESWFCSAQTCREENSESFAGQHAANSTSFYIFDEASAVPDVIWEVAEGGLTDGEPMVFAFGNPTRNSGKFHSCFNSQRTRWNTRQVDSRTVKLTNKKLIAEWVEDYGENSDFVKVRVRGMFPSLSLKQFISTNDVDNAFNRHLRKDQYDFAPRIITCDPAWEGDDALVISMRQGLKFEILRTMPKNDNDIYVANIIAQLEDQHQADAVFVDGGYGTGIISAGRTMGRSWQIVWFSGESGDAGCLNKRAEMWKLARDWLKEGGAIPNDQELYRELIGPETVPRLDGKIQIESKKDMKKRGQPSPNKADSLVLSFAMPVVKKPRSAIEKFAHGAVNNNNREYDPLANY